jgi:hypothetical protein
MQHQTDPLDLDGYPATFQIVSQQCDGFFDEAVDAE